MKRKVLIITLGLLLLLIAWGLVLLSENTVIRIEVNPHKKISFYKVVFIDVQNDDYESLHDKRFGRGTLWVEGRLIDNLKEMGFNWGGSIDNLLPNRKDTDMIVTCHLTYGWGIPRSVGHHFGIEAIEARFTKTIIIEFLDAQNKTLLAKALYRRGFADSADGDVDKVFDELKKKLKEIGSWSEQGGRTGVSP